MQSDSRFPKLTPRSSNISALPLFENDEHDDTEDDNLIIIDESEYNRNSDGMSDETATHQPNYLPEESTFDKTSLPQLMEDIQDKNDSSGDKQQILRLQQQLDDLSAKLKETQRIHQQIQLMHHSPLNMSNLTQRICAKYSNASSLSSHISHIAHDANQTMPHLINMSSYNYPYFNHRDDNKKKRKKRKRSKRAKRSNPQAICSMVAEKSYRKKKKIQREKSSIWPSFKCLDLRLCFTQTDSIIHSRKVASVHSL